MSPGISGMAKLAKHAKLDINDVRYLVWIEPRGDTKRLITVPCRNIPRSEIP